MQALKKHGVAHAQSAPITGPAIDAHVPIAMPHDIPEYFWIILKAFLSDNCKSTSFCRGNDGARDGSQVERPADPVQLGKAFDVGVRFHEYIRPESPSVRIAVGMDGLEVFHRSARQQMEWRDVISIDGKNRFGRSVSGTLIRSYSHCETEECRQKMGEIRCTGRKPIFVRHLDFHFAGSRRSGFDECGFMPTLIAFGMCNNSRRYLHKGKASITDQSIDGNLGMIKPLSCERTYWIAPKFIDLSYLAHV
nr:hypothetical protein [Rhizobium gallicum]